MKLKLDREEEGCIKWITVYQEEGATIILRKIRYKCGQYTNKQRESLDYCEFGVFLVGGGVFE